MAPYAIFPAIVTKNNVPEDYNRNGVFDPVAIISRAGDEVWVPKPFPADPLEYVQVRMVYGRDGNEPVQGHIQRSSLHVGTVPQADEYSISNLVPALTRVSEPSTIQGTILEKTIIGLSEDIANSYDKLSDIGIAKSQLNSIYNNRQAYTSKLISLVNIVNCP